MQTAPLLNLRKLKPEKSVIGLVPAVTTMIVFIALWLVWDRDTAYGFMAFALLGFGVLLFITYLRIGNAGFLFNALFILLGGLTTGALHDSVWHFGPVLMEILLACQLCSLVITIYLVVTRKYKWRGREILETAATPIDETRDGFTPRPHPLGRADYSQRELMEFARYVRRRMIALPYVKDDRVIFVPLTMARSLIHLYGWKVNLADETWVSFDFGGNVSVNIARKDYLKYREDLSFDQLCQSLGRLFIEFLERYKRGEGARIVSSLNALRENPFT